MSRTIEAACPNCGHASWRAHCDPTRCTWWDCVECALVIDARNGHHMGGKPTSTKETNG